MRLRPHAPCNEEIDGAAVYRAQSDSQTDIILKISNTHTGARATVRKARNAQSANAVQGDHDW